MNGKKLKVLIIKLGYCETLHNEVTEITSLGDVFRHTVLLNLYKNDQVTWLTSLTAAPLLAGNPYISRLMFFDLMTVLQLQAEQFDVVINLEKVPGLCALADAIQAWQRYGFRYNAAAGAVEAYKGGEHVLDLSASNSLKKKDTRTLQDLLFDVVGAEWNGEDYILGYRPKTEEVFDVGFNTEVGIKWPSKKWGLENWKRLEKFLKNDGYTVSWQKGLNDLFDYMDWINSCRTIVTNDSLCLHLGLALKKQVIALFGPTFSKEIHMYGRGVILKPAQKLGCMPCMQPQCKHGKSCIDLITAEDVLLQIQAMHKPQKEAAVAS